MKVIFIAGPYRAKTEWEILENIRRAEAIAVKVWQAGMVALCPHKNTAYFGGLCPDQTWLDGGLELLRRCDGLVLVPGWHKSPGTIGKIKEAKRLGIPIYDYVEEIEP